MITIPAELTMGGALLLLYITFLIGITTALIGMMFQYFMETNMILYPWAVFLSWLAEKNEVLRHLTRPFGRCRFCNSIWICAYAYMYIIGLNPLILFAFAFNFIGVWFLSNYVFKATDPTSAVDKIRKVQFKHEYTPWQAMLKTYAIIGFGYSIIYGVIPFIV
jgi:hypothetical protein